MIAPIETPRESEVGYRSAVMPPRMYSHENQSQEVVSPIGDRITNAIGRYPLVAIAASAAMGVTLGWLVKRKWNG